MTGANSTQAKSDIDRRALTASLAAQIEGEVRFDRISQAPYSSDASVYQILPLGARIPMRRADVVRTVSACRHFGASITARRGGTPHAGQAMRAGPQS